MNSGTCCYDILSMQLENNYFLIFFSRLRRSRSLCLPMPSLRILGSILFLLLLGFTVRVGAKHFWLAGNRAQVPVMICSDVCALKDHPCGDVTLRCTDLSALFDPDYFYQSSPPVVFWTSKYDPPLKVQTTLELSLQHRLNVLLHRYAPLVGAGVVIDPTTGAILAMASYRHEGLDPNTLSEGKSNYCLYGGFPAASLIKIVTAGAVLEKKGFTSHKTLPVSGRFHTLYKHQLGLKRQRFKAQPVSLEKAFSLSVNPFFGKLGIQVLKESELMETARSFLFNVPIKFDFPLDTSKVVVPDSEYARAEQACGFNTGTTISPLHAALIASLPVNEGKMMRPFLVERLENQAGVELFYRQLKVISQPFKEKSVKNLQRLMQATVRYGTAKKSFAHLRRVRGSKKWVLGGKTGTIDLPNRQGRCEWFAGYGESGHRKAAVAIVLVHGERRTISSSYVAAEMIKSALRSPPLKIAKGDMG